MTNYFLRADGNDAADGLSEATAWRTMQRLSEFHPEPGDVIRLRGGDTFGGLDWAYKGVGGRIGQKVLLTNYGNGVPILRPPVNQPAIQYAGDGGIAFRNLKLVGSISGREKTGGLVIGGQEGATRDIEISGIEASGFGEGGIWIQGGDIEDVRINQCHLHHNFNGLFVSNVRHVTVEDVLAEQNDYTGTDEQFGSTSHSGTGILLAWVRGGSVKRCRANRNGRLTTHGGGHTGFTFTDCDFLDVSYCEAVGNHDPMKSGDGQSFCVYGGRNGKIYRCVATDNLTGFALFNDEFTTIVDGWLIEDNAAVNNVTAFLVHGTVTNCTVTGNQFLATGPRAYKAMDVNNQAGAPNYRRNLRVFGNTLRADRDLLLIEALPGLAGVEFLHANDMSAEGAEAFPYKVYERYFLSLTEALAAAPAEV